MKKVPLFILSSVFTCLSANADLINIFPIDPSKQIVSSYIDPNSPDYDTPLLTVSQQYQSLQEFYAYYFSSTGSDQSPWNPTFVNKFITSVPFANFEDQVLTSLALPSKYRSSFQLWTSDQINALINEMNLGQTIPQYNDANRAIAVTDIQSRVIPSNEPNFRKYSLPGEGYPFDYSLGTTVYAGTPLYIIAKSASGKWLYVLTPRIATWVPASDIAVTDQSFVAQWQNAARKNLVAIIKNNTPLSTADGYTIYTKVGSVFPASQAIGKKFTNYSLMIPERESNGEARIVYTNAQNMLADNEVATMPLSATPHNFANLLTTMQNKTYGWCGYNEGTDGALEMQSLMTPFGFFMPRYVTDEMNKGKVVILPSDYTPSQKQQYIMSMAHKLVTLVTYGAQISLYVGNSNTYEVSAPIIYQNMWGLRDPANTYRTVVGQSVLFPLLTDYSVINPSLTGLLSPFSYTVKISYLDDNTTSTSAMSKIDFKHYIFPEWMLENNGNILDAANK